MLDFQKLKSNKKEYRNIFVVENITLWNKEAIDVEKESDLVLCLDFGLFKKLNDEGYHIAFLDNIADKETLDKANSEMNWFFNNWHLDKDGKPILAYKGLNIGDALLINVLNTITCFCNMFFSVSQIKHLQYKKLFLLVQDFEIENVLSFCHIDFIKIDQLPEKQIFSAVYSFPIEKWFKQATQNSSIKKKLSNFISVTFDSLFLAIDSIFAKKRERIFIQNYHPTSEIIKRFIKNSKYQVILASFIKGENIVKQRRVGYNSKKHPAASQELMHLFMNVERKVWNYEGYNLGDFLYPKIEIIVRNNIELAIANCASIIDFFSKKKLSLMIPVTNLWVNNRLLMLYCKENNIPVFMIINGLLNVEHWQDGQDSQFVNCYSESIKEDYFKNRKGVLALGDPRMDKYAVAQKKNINRHCPTISIGAAGYDSIDMNSYLTFEFDFLYDILAALSNLREDFAFNLILKVRANGYSDLYQSFVEQYFSPLNIKILQDVSFAKILEDTDLYISFYSQTLIEASALGIPVIYYKKDEQTIFRPFDGKSELVTAYDLDQLENQIRSFYAKHEMYDDFLKVEVLEKYIGPLDGNNLQRNIDFINSILEQKNI